MIPLDLDANASVPPMQSALAAMWEAARVPGNPSSTHAGGRAARRVLDRAREEVAAALGARDKEVFFTSGASEGNRWLVDAVVRAGEMLGRPLAVWSSPLEHPSLRKAPDAAAASSKLHLAVGVVSSAGALDLADERIAAAEIVFCTAAHNETGIVPDLDALADRVGASAALCVDAAQAAARLAVLPAGVDAAVISAHKLGGLAGAGAVLLRGNARRLPAPWAGGGQEGGLRPGTEATALLACMGAACRLIDDARAAHRALAQLRDRLERELLAAWPGARAIGATVARLPNTTAIVLPDVDGDALRMAIDRADVCVGFGAACSALAPEPSPSLVALGLTKEEARATVRLSLPPAADGALVDEALRRLLPVGAALLAKARARAAGGSS